MRNYWAPHVTVAAVVERDGRFLMVEERDESGRLVINQPAGHLEPGESLIEAVIRETREETGYALTPTGLLGIYQWQRGTDAGAAFLRFAFRGTVSDEAMDTGPDPDIIATHWLSVDEILHGPRRLRSPMVARSLRAAQAGRTVDLDLIEPESQGASRRPKS